MDRKQFGISTLKRWHINSNFLMEGSGKGRTFQVKQKPGVMDFSERQGAWHSVCRGKREFWR